MPSDARRLDEILLPTNPLTDPPIATAPQSDIVMFETREVIWLEWEEHVLTEVVLREEDHRGIRY